MRITKYGLRTEDGLRNSLVRESSRNYPGICENLNCPEKIADMMKIAFDLHHQADEYVYLLCFNQKMRLIGVFEISHGAVNYALASSRSVYIRAVLCSAVRIVLVHNHPSGDPAPSNEDIALTKKIQEAGKLMDIPLQDHIVIGGEAYVSMREADLF